MYNGGAVWAYQKIVASFDYNSPCVSITHKSSVILKQVLELKSDTTSYGSMHTLHYTPSMICTPPHSSPYPYLTKLLFTHPLFS